MGSKETGKVRILIILGTYLYLNFDGDQITFYHHPIPNVHINLTLTMHQLTGLQFCILVYSVTHLCPWQKVTNSVVDFKVLTNGYNGGPGVPAGWSKFPADKVSSSSDANEEELLVFPVFLHLLRASVFLLFHFFPSCCFSKHNHKHDSQKH